MKINHLNILESTSLPPQASVLLRILDPRFHFLTSVWITTQQFMLGFCLHLVFKVGIRRTARNNQELLWRHVTEISKRDHKGTKKKKILPPHHPFLSWKLRAGDTYLDPACTEPKSFAELRKSWSINMVVFLSSSQRSQ